MRKWLLLLMVCLLWIQPLYADTSSSTATQKTPRGSITDPSYKFDPVIEGDVITHEFTIGNTGTAPLEILKFESGWGCTAATSDRLILPGEEGKIKATFVTQGYGGRMVREVVKIHTNDPAHRILTISMSGEVRQMARLTPEIAILRGKPGEKISAQVKIVPAAVPDFDITSAQAKVGRDIDFTIEKKGTPPDNYFLLTVNNIKEGAGRYFDIIVLKTGTIPQRDIRVRVSGHLQP